MEVPNTGDPLAIWINLYSFSYFLICAQTISLLFGEIGNLFAYKSYDRQFPKMHTFEHKFQQKKEQLEIVNTYTYLGVPFQRNSSFKNAAAHFIAKTTPAASQVWDVCRQARVPPIATHVKLFNSLAKTVLLYAAPVWSLDYIEDIEKAPVKFFKRLIRLPNSIPDYAVRLELGLTKIRPLLIKQTLNFC